jgi:hypothetical protein
MQLQTLTIAQQKTKTPENQIPRVPCIVYRIKKHTKKKGNDKIANNVPASVDAPPLPALSARDTLKSAVRWSKEEMNMKNKNKKINEANK